MILMSSIVQKKLHPTEAIIEALPQLEEAFVTFYGEVERENIRSKFINMIHVGYCRPDNMEIIIRAAKKEKSKELIEKFLNNLNGDKETFMKIFFNDNNYLEYQNTHPIYNYIQYLNNPENKYYKEEAVKFLNQLHDKEVTIENIDNLRKKGEFKKYEKLIQEYNQIVVEYKNYQKIFEPYEEYIKKCRELKASLEKKYTRQLVEAFSYLFTEEELQQIENELNNKYKSSIKDTNKKTKNLFGWLMESQALIDAFSEESEEILQNGTSWRKKSIIQDRIKYFKNLGIDLGDDYQAYLDYPELKKIFPALKELAEKIINKRNELYTKMQNEYYSSLPEFIKNIEQFEQAGLLDRDHGYNANAYERNGTFISTNIKKTESGYISYPILCLSMGGLAEYLDHSLIHELNHVYELHLHKIEGKKYYMTCGWDIVDGEIFNQSQEEVSLEEKEEKRNYELFNEIINELISQEITEILFKMNGYIFNERETAKIKGGTSYENNLFLVREFYNTYKKEIIESRKEGNIQIIYDAVGKENFEALNELFHIYAKEFPGLTIYGVYQSIKKGEETEKTKIYKDLYKKRDEILSSMHEHYKSRNISR